MHAERLASLARRSCSIPAPNAAKTSPANPIILSLSKDKVTSKLPLWDSPEVAEWLFERGTLSREDVVEVRRLYALAPVCIAERSPALGGLFIPHLQRSNKRFLRD